MLLVGRPDNSILYNIYERSITFRFITVRWATKKISSKLSFRLKCLQTVELSVLTVAPVTLLPILHWAQLVECYGNNGMVGVEVLGLSDVNISISCWTEVTAAWTVSWDFWRSDNFIAVINNFIDMISNWVSITDIVIVVGKIELLYRQVSAKCRAIDLFIFIISILLILYWFSSVVSANKSWLITEYITGNLYLRRMKQLTTTTMTMVRVVTVTRLMTWTMLELVWRVSMTGWWLQSPW